MTPSMPSAMITSATITSMRVKPRGCRALTARTANTLLVLFVFGRLGLRDQAPFAIGPALLDPQVAVGQRCHAPQGRRPVALDVQLERYDVAARQDGELRRVFLMLVLLGAVGQSRFEHDLAAFHPEPDAQSLGQRALRVQLVLDDRLPFIAPCVEAQELVVVGADEDRHVDGLQLRFLARLAHHRPEAPRLVFDLAIRAEHADRQGDHRDHHADDDDDDEDLEEREAVELPGTRGSQGHSVSQLPRSALMPSPPSWPSAPSVKMSYSPCWPG